MAHNYKIAVYIGRFQPLHAGHLHVIEQGLQHADQVFVLVGSATGPRSHRNPFTFAERRSMIVDSIPAANRGRVKVVPLEDAAYNDSKWITQVQTLVERTAWQSGFTVMPDVALLGHRKDSTSYYLNMFPQWDSFEATNYHNISSTNIRNSYFSNIGHMWLKDADGHKEGDLPQDRVIPTPVKQFLDEFVDTQEYRDICAEYEFVRKYRASWDAAPYPVNLVCVDACVIKSGHVLLVERGALPGKGQLALPGGYLNVTERAVDGMIRELREETRLKVPEAVLRGSITRHEVFDDPNRSARGRVMTIGYLVDLGTGALDKVRGSDDAAHASWVPLADLRRDNMFEDHYSIIEYLVGM